MKWKLIPSWRSVKPLLTVRGLVTVALYHAVWLVTLAMLNDLGVDIFRHGFPALDVPLSFMLWTSTGE